MADIPFLNHSISRFPKANFKSKEKKSVQEKIGEIHFTSYNSKFQFHEIFKNKNAPLKKMLMH